MLLGRRRSYPLGRVLVGRVPSSFFPKERKDGWPNVLGSKLDFASGCVGSLSSFLLSFSDEKEEAGRRSRIQVASRSPARGFPSVASPQFLLLLSYITCAFNSIVFLHTSFVKTFIFLLPSVPLTTSQPHRDARPLSISASPLFVFHLQRPPQLLFPTLFQPPTLSQIPSSIAGRNLESSCTNSQQEAKTRCVQRSHPCPSSLVPASTPLFSSFLS